MAVGIEDEGNLHYEIGLKEVPVVVGHTVGNDCLGPFLEGAVDEFLIVGYEWLDERVHLSQFIEDVLVDNLKLRHSHECLHMAVVEVDGHVAVVDAFHINIETFTAILP